MNTSLIGQDEQIETLSKILSDPPHLFFSGCYGCGKTTLMTDFLTAYYAQHELIYPDSRWILTLSSEQDRGIHCIRQNVAEFVRHTSAKPGVYRWIIIDDADSLPIISQQALRRPMETHDTTTRFIFCSRHASDLIQPLRSRCLHIELDTISPFTLLDHFKREFGLGHIEFTPEAKLFLLYLVQTPTEIRNILRIVSTNPAFRSEPVSKEYLLQHFTAPSFSLCSQLIAAFIDENHDEMTRIFFEIWSTGISYEDLLFELVSATKQFGLLSPAISQTIHQIILKGWITYAQGKTHILDLMRIFLGHKQMEYA